MGYSELKKIFMSVNSLQEMNEFFLTHPEFFNDSVDSEVEEKYAMIVRESPKPAPLDDPVCHLELWKKKR